MTEEREGAGIVPVFKIHSSLNEGKTKEAGRPIYDDLEVVEIRMAANRNSVGVFPAHEVWRWEDTPNGRAPVTYAMRFRKQYEAFKSQSAQTKSGTPLEELPFLTQAKRYELKALNIHTAEALASLDGQPLRNLGIGGRELKDQATTYIQSAKGLSEIEKLKAENSKLKADAKKHDVPVKAEAKTVSPFADEDDETLREIIKDATGKYPNGQPSHATLVATVDRIMADKEDKEDKE